MYLKYRYISILYYFIRLRNPKYLLSRSIDNGVSYKYHNNKTSNVNILNIV